MDASRKRSATALLFLATRQTHAEWLRDAEHTVEKKKRKKEKKKKEKKIKKNEERKKKRNRAGRG